MPAVIRFFVDIYYPVSVSNICNSNSTVVSNPSVTDAVIENNGRVRTVQANAHVIVGNLINYNSSNSCKGYYKLRVGGGQYTRYFEIVDEKYYCREWQSNF